MQTFDYDDIQLIPNKCIIKSRKEADTSIKFGPKTFKIPVVPANMESVIDEDLAIWLAQNDYYYVMHRFNPETRAAFVKMMHEKGRAPTGDNRGKAPSPFFIQTRFNSNGAMRVSGSSRVPPGL